MTPWPGLSAEQVALLAWEASFLPELVPAAAGPALGIGEPQVQRWPKSQRLAAAVQLLAAATFLLERGFFPSRRLLASARVTRSPDGVAVRLPGLPRWRLDTPGLDGRLQRVVPSGRGVLVGTLWPLLGRLLPELRPALEDVAAQNPSWEVAPACLAALLVGNREAALAHPEGRGRALWAYRIEPAGPGVWWVEDERTARRAAAVLAHAAPELEVAVGELDEDEVVRVQARAAASGRDVAVLTLLPLPAARMLGLDTGPDAAWVMAPRWERGQAHLEALLHSGERRPGAARLLLAAGAARGFAEPPAPPVEVPGRLALASPPARRLLRWLGSCPAGLAESELEVLLGPSGDALAELERLGLAGRRGGRWHARLPGPGTDAACLERLATDLPEGSAGRVLAMALTGRGEGALLAWCEQRLDGGESAEVLEVAGAAARSGALALAAAEAALRRGRLRRAESLLDGVDPAARTVRWQALRAWWAEAAGLPEAAEAALALAPEDALPPRLVARTRRTRAALARQRRERGRARALLAEVVAGTGDCEAELELAALDGTAALRRLARERRTRWSDEVVARYLHLLGLSYYEADKLLPAGTALRAALRAVRAENLMLVGEIHLDLGCVAILLERRAAAERHLQLAERLLEGCGSRMALTVARHNRAVLACDRLDPGAAEALIAASREPRGGREDAAFWLGELELARCALARGDTAAVAARLPALAAAVGERLPDHQVARQALARLGVNLALAAGDLEAARVAAADCDESEQAGVEALLAAARGESAPVEPPARWGLALSAMLVRGWTTGDGDPARARFEAELVRAPLEAAVGAVRALAVAARLGIAHDGSWNVLWGRVEAALAAGGLDGWAHLLRRLRGVDPAALVAALDGILAAGSDALAPARLTVLASALGLPWLRVRDGDEVLVELGKLAGEAEGVGAGAVRVESRAPLSGTELATLRLLARHVGEQRARPDHVATLSGGALLGVSPAMVRVREEISRWAPLPVVVLILGEPGTGKELCARELHRQSQRRGAFVPINCAGIPAALLEAELFGSVRGAFTGADRDRPGLVEEAEGGTLFLDEVGELPLELQGKLLRLLQEREVRRVGATRTRTVDVRFVAATNRDLAAAVEAGAFRPDLFYRLSVGVIRMPPLRERPDDVDELARFFTHRYAAAFGRHGVRLAPAAIAVLRAGAWAGNVRELESTIARAVAAARPGEVLGPDRFPELVHSPAASAPSLQPYEEALGWFRRDYFLRLLEACGGNRSEAARRAGISRQTLLYHLRQLAIR